MSDYSTIRSLTSSTSLKNIKPVVYKELNNVRLLPNGWEDEILKISSTYVDVDRTLIYRVSFVSDNFIFW